jgi:hypothetical protein
MQRKRTLRVASAGVGAGNMGCLHSSLTLQAGVGQLSLADVRIMVR